MHTDGDSVYGYTSMAAAYAYPRKQRARLHIDGRSLCRPTVTGRNSSYHWRHLTRTEGEAIPNRWKQSWDPWQPLHPILAH